MQNSSVPALRTTYLSLNSILSQELKDGTTFSLSFILVMPTTVTPGSYFTGIQKAIKNVDISRFMIDDLFHLVSLEQERAVYELFIWKHEGGLRTFEVNDAYIDSHFEDNSLQFAKVVVATIKESSI